MNEIHGPAGQRVPVIRRAFSSIPADYRFTARAAIPGEKPAGIMVVRKSRWIFPGSPETLPLQASNVVSAGFWNTFLSVDVVPDVAVVITTGTRHPRKVRPLLILALVVIALAAIVVAAAGS